MNIQTIKTGVLSVCIIAGCALSAAAETLSADQVRQWAVPVIGNGPVK